MKISREFKVKWASIGAAVLLGIATLAVTGCGSKDEGFDKSKDITVVSRESGSGTRGAFIELFGIEEKDADGNKKDTTTKDAVTVSSTSVVLTNVASNTYAIGYVSLGSLNDTVKALKIDGAEATAENIKNGTYKISRPFNIATKSDVSDLAKDFIGYILSTEGQKIIEDNNYLSAVDKASAYTVTDGLSGKIVVGGSSSVSPVMEKLKEAYEKINKGVTIELQTSDSSSGMKSTIKGTYDIGMASRELKDSEKEELTSTVIAIDGIAVIVNKDNENDGLTSDQIKKIFQGTTKNWEME